MNGRLSQSDTLSAESIRAGLTTSCIGREVLYLPTTTSTNRIAKEGARKGMREGTLVITDHQTEGRGRLERRWLSHPGRDLLFSLVFRPSLSAAQTFRLTAVSSLAVAEAIRKITGLDARIKWPNDIYIAGKKTAGILSETGLRGEELVYLVVGIGINVNSDPSDHPEIEDTATSLRRESGRCFPRLSLLAAILELVEGYYHGLQHGGFTAIKKRWDALSLIRNKRVAVTSPGNSQEGIVESVDDDGCLTLRDHTGRKRRILTADLSLSLHGNWTE